MKIAANLISIIIPTYNYGHRIEKALTSILEQEDLNTETVIIDDGSTDQTEVLVKAFQEKHPTFNLKYYIQLNKGVSVARNNGLKKANGDYVLFLDADDYLLPNSLRLFREAIFNFPEAGMIAAGHLSCKEKRQIVTSHPFKQKLTSSNEKNFLYYLRRKIALGAGSSIYQKKVFENIQFPESVKNGEDVSVFFQVLATQICASISEPVVMHNKHKNSLRRQFSLHKEAGIATADFIFNKEILAPKFLKYRNEYISARYLSLSRVAFRHEAFGSVVEYYENAINHFPLYFFKLGYLKRYIKARLKLIVK